LTFPNSIESAEYFGVAYNGLSTYLTKEASASDTTIYVASTDNFPSSGWVTIEDEIIYYTGKTAGSFTGCTRGADNTVAAIHQSSKTVSLTYTAAMHNRIVQELRATQTKLGDNNTFLVTPSSAPTSDYQVANKKYVDDQVTLSAARKFSRDRTLASGDVSYTGVGFQPTSIIIFGGVDGTSVASWGMADVNKNNFCISLNASAKIDVSGFTYSLLVMLIDAIGTYQQAILKSYDPDGFTLTWTKGGSPTGTAYLTAICFR